MSKAWLLCLVVLSGCASVGKREFDAVPKKTEAPDTSHVAAVLGRFAAAHACPINDHFMLTNAHVIDQAPGNPDFAYQSYRWTTDAGEFGQLTPLGTIAGVDLALMQSTPIEKWYERSTTPPLTGDKLWLVEFDYSSRDKAFASHPVQVEVTRLLAGHIFYKPIGKPGSSGSCVLNEEGKLVGINLGGYSLEANGDIGLAVAVYGDWFKTPEGVE